MTTQPIDRKLRLALLLADGTGDYDFAHAIAIQETVYLDGHVPSYEHKRRAEDLARCVGFDDVHNTLHVAPGDEGGVEHAPGV